MTRKGILVVAVVALVALLTLAGAGYAETAQPTGITVNGAGAVTTRPNLSTWSFAAVGRGETASDALRASSGKMQAIIAALKRNGVAPKDLQTEQVSLYRDDKSGTYVATNGITAKVRDLGRSGAIVDAAVAAGATNVSGPIFTREDQQALYRQALAAAFADARAKAKSIAARAGVRLGRPTSIQEGSNGPIVFDAVGAARAAGPAPKVPVEPGRTQVQASVTVIFAIS